MVSIFVQWSPGRWEAFLFFFSTFASIQNVDQHPADLFSSHFHSTMFFLSSSFVDKISMMYDSTMLELKNILRAATNNDSAAAKNASCTYDKNNDNTIQLQSCPCKRSDDVHANSALINIIRMDKKSPSNTNSEEHSNNLFDIIYKESRINNN